MTIPANAIVNVIPSVIAAGGSALDLNGLLLTQSPRVPNGTVGNFPSSDAVAAYFGATSDEALFANDYFDGYDNSDLKPGALLIAQYPPAPVQAYLRGGRVSGLTLAQLQAITGVLNVTIDGVLKTIGAVNIAAATSFSNAAKILDTALGVAGPTDGVMTASIAATVLTVTAVTSGLVKIGSVVSGGTVTAGTRVLAQLTGTPGGIGTYTVDTSQTAASAALTFKKPGVGYDALLGSFFINSGTTGAASTITFGSGSAASPLGLQASNAAVVSPGAIAGVPGTNLTALVAINQNWASFTTLWEPVTSDKVLFGEWTNSRNNRFGYAMWDTDAAPTIQPDTTSAGALLRAEGASGIMPIGGGPNTTYLHAALEMSIPASYAFDKTNGRTTFAFRTQSGLSPNVVDQTIAANLIANGYNFYGAYATANEGFQFLYPGQISGSFKWGDSYFNQIKLNNDLQLAVMNLLVSVGSIPYNADGRTLMEAAFTDPIQAALTFGTIRAGVTLSAAQVAEVNADAGARISDILQQRGWYLQIQDATAAVRIARGSPPCTLWYLDGQSVQQVNLASIQVQ